MIVSGFVPAQDLRAFVAHNDSEEMVPEGENKSKLSPVAVMALGDGTMSAKLSGSGSASRTWPVFRGQVFDLALVEMASSSVDYIVFFA